MKIMFVNATNFRSYKELNWSLPSNGLFLIDGENLDTGRNNMTGKTTLIDAIFWGLFGYLPKWGGVKGGPVDAVIKRGETSCSVVVTVENEGKKIIINRQRPNKLKVQINGESIDGKSSDLDSRIPDLIGMTADQFLISVYISQDRKQSFFSMSETERTQLLSQVSKVEDINRAMERARLSKQTLESDIEKQKSYTQGIEFQLTTLPESVQIHQNAVNVASARWDEANEKLIEIKELNVSRVKHYEETHQFKIKNLSLEYEQKHAELVMTLKEAEAELSLKEVQLTQSPRVEIEYTQKIEELKAQIAKAQRDNHEGLQQEAKNSIARAALKNIADQIESSQNGTCDHCGQDLPANMREQHITELLAHVPRWESSLKDVPPKIDTTDLQVQLDHALHEYAKRKATLESGPARLQFEVDVIKKGLALQKQSLIALETGYKKDIRDLDIYLSTTMRELDHIYSNHFNSVENLASQVQSAQRSLELIKKQADQLQAEIDTNKMKVFSLQKQLDEALDLIDLFKGFRQVCFEDLIARISERAGDLLSLMTDGIYTTRIDQVGETAKGEMKLILKPMITKGGQDVPLDDLSGGARRTVMLAYDVAVAESVGDSNVLFLDEALDGLDTIGKGEAMKLLEEVARTKGVMVIDHSSELKAGFSSIIKVVYKDETSHLEEAG